MITRLKNSRILFFSPVFFGYEKAIETKLSLISKECVFFDERANPSTLDKILIRLSLNFLIKKRITKYYQEIIDLYGENYFDYVIFFNPETISDKLLLKLKKKQNKAKFILYMWDSLKNKPRTKELISYFDSSLTFNKEDSTTYNMRFRPLFFIDEYNADFNPKQSKNDIDICFIGTIHSDRYFILKEIEKQSKKNKLKVFYYLYFPSIILFYKYKLENLGKLEVKKKNFKFQALKSDEIRAIMDKSNVIVDIQHPNQTGLTMRTIEMLGLKKKIITTNQDIINYDFYNANNVSIIDRKDIKIDLDFMTTAYDDSNNKIRNKYSIDQFLEYLIFS